ncbi:MAG: methyltransferase [Ferrimonas sp.]
MSSYSLEQRVTTLVMALSHHQSIWQSQPYHQDSPDWLQQWPSLGHWLVHLTDAECRSFEANELALLTAAQCHLPVAATLAEYGTFPLSMNPLDPIDNHQFAHVPGRKLAQIRHFYQALPQQVTASRLPVLEWCAGKGHLGRLFALHGHEVSSLEYDSILCDEGNRLAHRLGRSQQFECLDALSGAAEDVVHQQQLAVALHACGDLHQRLLQNAVMKHTVDVVISPCCYHLSMAEPYQPMSHEVNQLLAQHKVQLNKQSLRLAVQQTMTAPERVKRLRAIEISYRHSFNALLAQLQITDKTLASCSKKVFSQSLEVFCRWACEQLNIVLPNQVDWPQLAKIGEVRWQQQRRLELARALFRRALEGILVLDRALYLQQHGYQTNIVQFCEPQITPRNLLILAHRYRQP